MKLGIRILLSFLLIFGLGLYYLTSGEMDKVRYRYLEGVEDPMVDQARILAAFVADDMENETFSREKMHRIFKRTYGEFFSARIYDLNKISVDMRVYITNKSGIVLFDSMFEDNEGEDYSRWRDVYWTLKGRYGARSSMDDPDHPDLRNLYVAAPIHVKGEIAGVLTVAKPTTNINNFLKTAKSRMMRRSLVVLLLVTGASIFVILVLTRPIKLLTRYANKIREGEKAVLPGLDKTEIGEMGRALEKMREALEGKKYVEKYVQTLTHEIKSPISAIKGASELLEEDMPASHRGRFLANIRGETERIERLVERMLALSSLEKRDGLEEKKITSFGELVDGVLERMAPTLSKKKIALVRRPAPEIEIACDPFLLKQLISNLLQNALDFSAPGDEIEIAYQEDKEDLRFTLRDQGPGVPDFAMEKIFDRFFSLQRPGNGKKSTGLGLNFVKEIAALHGGEIRLENRPGKGARAILTLPCGP